MKRLQNLVCNVGGAAVRHETMMGKEYLVAPVAMMTEGVHAGSNGPLYYPADELGDNPGVWNCTPIVIYHPEKDGRGLSAKDPDILTNRGVGLIMNSKWDNKLRAEAWFDEVQLKKVDNRVYEAIEAGKMMEVSTGVFTDNEEVEGEWNGEKYIAIARNYKPDHLAILPDKEGACSIKDGAGLLQLNSASLKMQLNSPLLRKKGLLQLVANHGALKAVTNELSHSAIYSALSSSLRDKIRNWSGWIEDVFDSYFIYWEDGTLWQQKYLATDTSVTLVEDASKVVRVTSYEPVANAKASEDTMKKKEFIDGLIANKATKWGEEDRKFLEGLDENQLAKFESEPVKNEADPDDEDDDDGEVKPAANAKKKKKAPPMVDEPAPSTYSTPEEYIAAAPPGMQGVLAAGLASYNAQKAAAIKTITGNKANTLDPSFLQTKELPELQALAALASSGEPKQPIMPGFAGAATPIPVGNAATEEEGLSLPTFDAK